MYSPYLRRFQPAECFPFESLPDLARDSCLKKLSADTKLKFNRVNKKFRKLLKIFGPFYRVDEVNIEVMDDQLENGVFKSGYLKIFVTITKDDGQREVFMFGQFRTINWYKSMSIEPCHWRIFKNITFCKKLFFQASPIPYLSHPEDKFPLNQFIPKAKYVQRLHLCVREFAKMATLLKDLHPEVSEYVQFDLFEQNICVHNWEALTKPLKKMLTNCNTFRLEQPLENVYSALAGSNIIFIDQRIQTPALFENSLLMILRHGMPSQHPLATFKCTLTLNVDPSILSNPATLFQHLYGVFDRFVALIPKKAYTFFDSGSKEADTMQRACLGDFEKEDIGICYLTFPNQQLMLVSGQYFMERISDSEVIFYMVMVFLREGASNTPFAEFYAKRSPTESLDLNLSTKSTCKAISLP